MVTQVLSGAPATVSVQLADQDGNPRPAVGPVTVTALKSDGTALIVDAPATAGTDGVVSLGLSAADTAELDLLRLQWIEAGGATINSTVEVVGGYLFNVAEARESSSKLRDPAKYSDEEIIGARRAVTEELEKITGRSFVPRFKRLSLSGRYAPRVRIPDWDVRTVRSLTVDGLSAEGFASAGFLSLLTGIFNYGDRNIEVAYEYGLDEPPERIKDAALLRLQSLIALKKSGVPDRAEYQIIEGRVFSLNRLRGGLTGIKDIDDAYREWAAPSRSVGSVPLA